MSSLLSGIRETKPTQEILDIINYLKDKVKFRTGEKNKRILLTVDGKRQILLLTHGYCNLVRQWDRRTVLTLHSPILVGMGMPVDRESHLHVQAIDNIEYALLPVEIFEQYIAEFNLWRQLATIATWGLQAHNVYNKALAINDNLKIASLLLIELNNEPEFVRLNTTALAYIQDRTLLSRSWIMHFLSELKNAGHIELQRGILTKINGLPADIS
ncbi:helix-turn-helix domain-containing protein [Citrobacter amalonaticus]|uniref:helix-turn-helix domain-containing protein n=1 Tax=Citrobacter amalonaticus TaxID=35703 RepID=UPI00255AD2CC|nr:helix-turn-helix domain-containing protein [Citrobacter amalonaticus]MDL4618404.1 helix-turn-helix domain-containing protein [Citrobacter amalonaticus]MDL4622502.1 helix-turn-helix domain-containing protein [Citrobacter amalonaticus]